MVKKEQERRVLMEVFFKNRVTGDEESHIKKIIHQMMILNKKIITITEADKLEILKKMRGLSAGKNAVDAYAYNSFR